MKSNWEKGRKNLRKSLSDAVLCVLKKMLNEKNWKTQKGKSAIELKIEFAVLATLQWHTHTPAHQWNFANLNAETFSLFLNFNLVIVHYDGKDEEGNFELGLWIYYLNAKIAAKHSTTAASPEHSTTAQQPAATSSRALKLQAKNTSSLITSENVCKCVWICVCLKWRVNCLLMKKAQKAAQNV